MAPAIFRSKPAVVAANRLRKNASHSAPHMVASSTPSDNITAATDQPWVEVGSSSACLLPELAELYWTGVRNELEDILYALKEWQQPQFSEARDVETGDDFVHGFDTFVDQVCVGSRNFARRYGILHLPAPILLDFPRLDLTGCTNGLF